MIRRRDDGTIIITQSAHGWLAGQFAYFWGNDQFRFPALASDLIMAATNHDNGWVEWEKRPQVDALSRPIDFTEMAAEVHTDLWRQGLVALEAQNSYAALLVSHHARYLVDGRLRNNPGDENDQRILQDFLQQQKDWEQTTIDRLQQSVYFEGGCQPQILAANFRLLQVFDWLSLLLCMNKLSETTITDVPGQTLDERVTLHLLPSDARTFTLEPWPFRVVKFDLIVQARQLPAATFESDDAFQAAWQAAMPHILHFSVRQP